MWTVDELECALENFGYDIWDNIQDIDSLNIIGFGEFKYRDSGLIIDNDYERGYVTKYIIIVTGDGINRRWFKKTGWEGERHSSWEGYFYEVFPEEVLTVNWTKV